MSELEQKPRCWVCKSLSVIKWGTQNNKQRFKCKDCETLFIRINDGVKYNNELIWYKKWVLERQSLPILSRDSGLSISTLRRKFELYLFKDPKWIIPKTKYVHLVIDGTYFKNNVCLFLYRNNDQHTTLFYRVSTGEYAEEITEDLINIMKLGVVIVSITSDGHKGILKGIKGANRWIKEYNRKEGTSIQPIVFQRCLVHIQRNCLTLIKQEHKSVEGRRLRHICETLLKIDTLRKKELFIDALNYWFEKNIEYITQFSYSSSGRKWRTHKVLYSAYMSIKRALPNMFNYLEDAKIPSTTNALEGYFSHLKNDISFHRGISKKHFKRFIVWYIYFRDNR